MPVQGKKTIQISEAVHRAVKRHCVLIGESMEEFAERALAALMTPTPKAVPGPVRAETPLGSLLERWMRADSRDRVEMVTKLGVAVYIGAHDLEAALVEQLRSTET